MYWEISKEFDFCYGHRVWSQTLDKDLALDNCLKCRHLHGHQGKIIIHLRSDKLKEGMVTDFAHLNWFKQFLDDTLDHKFIIDINDPLFPTLLPHFKDKKDLIYYESGFWGVDFSKIQNEPAEIFEMYEGYVIVDFVPTSENISTWLMQIVSKKMKPHGVEVSHIEFLETPKSKSVVFSN